MDLSWLLPVIPALKCCEACPVFLGLRKVKRGSRKQGCKLLRSSRKIMTSLFFQTLSSLKVLEPFSSYLLHEEKCVFFIVLDVIIFLTFYSGGIYRHDNCFEIVFLLLQTWLVGREWELEIFIRSTGSISHPPFKYLPLLFLFIWSHCVRSMLSTEIEVHEALGIQHFCEVICFSKKRAVKLLIKSKEKSSESFWLWKPTFFFWKFYLLV